MNEYQIERVAQAAGIIGDAAHRLALLLEPGYGGPGQQLIELLAARPSEAVEVERLRKENADLTSEVQRLQAEIAHLNRELDEACRGEEN